MNRMTRTFAVASLMAVAVAGCTDLLLEPKSSVTEANVFTNANSYRAFIARVYAGLAVTGQQGPAGNADIQGIDEGFSQYLRIYWEAQELPTDEAVIAWNDVGLPELNTMTWSSSNGFVNAMYYRVYFQIMMANEFLRQTTPAKLNERGHAALQPQVDTYRAEARFLRALSYWHGLDLFGPIPLITEADVLGTLPAQATRQQIYDFIVAELNAILTDLPPVAGNYGRANQYAAQMLLAKVYLNAESYGLTPRYSEARIAAEAVIAGPFALDDVYQEIFLADNDLSPEIIFPVIQDGINTQTWGGMTFLTHATCGGSMNSNDYGHNGCWWGLRLRQQAYARYAAGDGRAAYFYTTGQNPSVASIGNFNDGIAAPKFQNITSVGDTIGGTHPDTDFPMFRLADAYLIYAEANLRGGGGSAATALGYVNLLRQRAYGDNSGDFVTLTLQDILDERGRELLWEGHRRSDLIRFGQFTGATYLWEWKGGVQAGQSVGAHLALYPIPANELVANPNLTQNPGY